MRLGDWVRAMQAAGLQATLDDLRDIAWLAGQLGGAPAAVPPAPGPSGVEPAPTPAPEARTGGPTPAPAAPRRGIPVPAGAADEAAPALYAAAAGGGTLRARRVQLRGAPALPQGLAIARALRPLSRRRPGRQLVLDERATAEFIADTGVHAPVWRPARERWFDVVLVAEDVPALAAWQPVLAAFEKLLQRQGGFRSVVRWQLRAQGTQLLASGPGGRPCSPRALHERDGRRILLALSDCTSDAWHRGTMGAWLQRAAAEVPVAVVQLLPPVLWPNTAVGFAELRTRAPRVAAPAARLEVRRPGWAVGEPGLVLPVLALEPAAVAAWARMVAAAGDAWAHAALLPLPAADDTNPSPPAPEPDADTRVAAFRASATLEAQRLAAYFSVVRPLTPPVMRVIHQAMAPESGAAALAQVFLAGVLRRVREGESPDDAVYDFHPGLRQRLEGGLTKAEFLQVNLALHDFLQQQSGTAFDFFALLEDREGSERLPEAAQPFVQMARSGARRFGGPAPAAAAPPAPAEPRVAAVAEIRISMGGGRLHFLHRSPRGDSNVYLALPDGAGELLQRALFERGESLNELRRAVLPLGLQDGTAYADGPPWAELVLDPETEPYPWELLFRSLREDRLPLALQRGLTRRPRGAPAARTPRARQALVAGPVRQEPGAARAAEVHRAEAALRGCVPGEVRSIPSPTAESLMTALAEPLALRVFHLAAPGQWQRTLDSEDGPRLHVLLADGGALGLAELALRLGVPELVFLSVDHAAAVAPRLLEAGAAVVVAPTGTVHAEAAALFADAFYRVLANGQTLLEATHQARAACYRQLPDADAWGRFQVWGDPAWRLVDEPAASAAPPPPTPPPTPMPAHSPAPSPQPVRMPPPPRPLPALSQCEHAAYVCYAQADDTAWFDWATHFGHELGRGLAAVLRGVRVPPLHLAADAGPPGARPGEERRARIASSFAMILLVHDHLVHSEWARQELAMFRETFGEPGLRERLYIVAMSEEAMLQLGRSPEWRAVLPLDELVWLPFFDPENRAQPHQIYLAPQLVSPQFRAPFERLRRDLAGKMKQGSVEPLPSPAPPPPAPPEPWAQEAVMGFVAPASAEAAQAAAARLGQGGLPLRLLGNEVVFSDFKAFDGADRLILAFDDHPPLMPSMAAGGHLELQRDAWLRRGRPPGSLLWLDLRPEPPPRERWKGAAAWVAQQGVPVLGLEALLAELRRGPAETPGAARTARVYIESNRHERNHWTALGQVFQQRWSELGANSSEMPALRVRGLPVDLIDQHPPLDDADGVVLLWGRKTAEALVAQISKVEAHLPRSGPQAPGVVAYLMPPNQADEPVPAWGWQVLRFDARDEGALRPLEEEVGEVDRFLSHVLRCFNERMNRNA